MTIIEIKRELAEIEFQMETLKNTYKGIPDPFMQIEYRTKVRTLLNDFKTLKSSLCDSLLSELKTAFPKEDAVYVDRIIEVVGIDGLYHLKKERKIEVCGCINGRYLYAI